MHISSRLVVLTLTCLVLSGCLSTVRIKRDPITGTSTNKQDVAGIPFYVKTAKCKQESTWIEPVYTLTLKKTTTYKFLNDAEAKKVDAKLPAPEVRTASKVLSKSQFQPSTNAPLQTLLALLNKPNTSAPDIIAIENAWALIIAKDDYIPLSTSEDDLIKAGKEVIETANTSTPEVVVDYKTVYYYNAPRPWVGTSQVDAKLAADGTLTEGSAQVQGQTLSTILTAVTSVFSTVVSKIPSFGPGAPPDATSTTTQYDLTVQKEAYQHTHTRYGDFSNPCAPAPGGVLDNYALTITLPNQPSSAKDDSSTVKVSGTVTLPKASPPAAAAPQKN